MTFGVMATIVGVSVTAGGTVPIEADSWRAVAALRAQCFVVQLSRRHWRHHQRDALADVEERLRRRAQADQRARGEGAAGSLTVWNGDTMDVDPADDVRASLILLAKRGVSKLRTEKP